MKKREEEKRNREQDLSLKTDDDPSRSGHSF